MAVAPALHLSGLRALRGAPDAASASGRKADVRLTSGMVPIADMAGCAVRHLYPLPTFGPWLGGAFLRLNRSVSGWGDFVGSLC